MQSLQLVRRSYQRLLEAITGLIVAALTVLIIAGTVFRYMDASLSWYDEVASVGLVWMTYFGSALAAAKGAHIGFPGLVNALPQNLRVASVILAELCVFGFFILLAYAGWEVLVILDGMTMTSLPSVSVQITQGIIPLGAVLFMIAEAMRTPEMIEDARRGNFMDHELKEALGGHVDEVQQPSGAEPVSTDARHGKDKGTGGIS
ncbi:TRAP transporter small permease [Fulvimarina endophytica]|uniref:TRAP transporter small permease protein n=1 Tax=Fulvimarina endophytica TaxID=2293836 RepID=A0A371WZA1_9HYPH|nr:TRAP transporter small permease [Fulvimarina endophytica]RFC62303.1 TRAP transporter small permease [Fulvimarina endophytica]